MKCKRSSLRQPTGSGFPTLCAYTLCSTSPFSSGTLQHLKSLHHAPLHHCHRFKSKTLKSQSIKLKLYSTSAAFTVKFSTSFCGKAIHFTMLLGNPSLISSTLKTSSTSTSIATERFSLFFFSHLFIFTPNIVDNILISWGECSSSTLCVTSRSDT